MRISVGKFFIQLKRLWADRNFINLLIRYILLLLVLILLYFILKPFVQPDRRKPDRQKQMTTFNDGTSGSMALKELLEAMGLSTGKIMDPLITLLPEAGDHKETGKQNNLILMIEPETDLTDPEIDSIEQLADQGAVFILFSGDADLLNRFLYPEKKREKGLKIFPRKKEEGIPVNLQDINENHLHLTGAVFKEWTSIGGLELNDKLCFISLPKGWEPVITHGLGTLAAGMKTGSGTVVLVTDAAFVSNLDLKKGDNSLLAYDLIRHYLSENQTILFDEYHHGYHQKYTLLYFFAKKEYAVWLLQIFLVLALLFYTTGIRFGQYRTDLKTEKKHIYYYSEGLAGLLSDRKYLNDLGSALISNTRKLMKLGFYRFSQDKIHEMELLMNPTAEGKIHLKKIKKILRLVR